MAKKYVVRLGPQEREDLHKLLSKGQGAARKLTHARILLKADVSDGSPGWTDERIAEALGVARQTVEHVRQRCVEQGLEAALERKKREHGPTPPFWTVRRKPSWWRSVAPSRLPGGGDGRCICWPIGWWN